MHLEHTITKSEVIVTNDVVLDYKDSIEVTAICEILPEYSVVWREPYSYVMEVETFKGRKILVDLSNPKVKRIYTETGEEI